MTDLGASSQPAARVLGWPQVPALRMEVLATDRQARAGLVRTARGAFETPCFMPVGTRAAVRTLSAGDLESLGVQVLLANTYHLMLRPGAQVVADLGGLHGFMGWGGHVLTDSGGYQVYSLDAPVDDGGVTFRSTYDGGSHRLTPEGAVAVQALLGADIQMQLDVCPALPAPPEVLRTAVERTDAWGRRAARAMSELRATGSSQALFGIVQGGTDPALRMESAERALAVGFDGYGVGGLSVGEGRQEMLEALEASLSVLPVEMPRYLMGVGDPVGLVEAVALGVDMFDCVLPTRLARHGTVLTDAGRMNLRALAHACDSGPLDPVCACPVCERHSRAYLRHLLRTREPTAPRLLTLHNLHWLLRLVRRAREAVAAGTLDDLRGEVRSVWA